MRSGALPPGPRARGFDCAGRGEQGRRCELFVLGELGGVALEGHIEAEGHRYSAEDVCVLEPDSDRGDDERGAGRCQRRGGDLG
jgi:hypothetical protein